MFSKHSFFEMCTSFLKGRRLFFKLRKHFLGVGTTILFGVHIFLRISFIYYIGEQQF